MLKENILRTINFNYDNSLHEILNKKFPAEKIRHLAKQIQLSGALLLGMYAGVLFAGLYVMLSH